MHTATSSNIGGDSLATFEIFSAGGQKDHISFDPTKAFSKPSGAYTAEEQKEKFATDDIASRAYLDNRTAWNGTPDTPMNAEGTTEITLEQGAAPDARVQVQKLNDSGDMLMVATSATAGCSLHGLPQTEFSVTTRALRKHSRRSTSRRHSSIRKLGRLARSRS